MSKRRTLLAGCLNWRLSLPHGMKRQSYYGLPPFPMDLAGRTEPFLMPGG
ncbi:MAG: hypothetical protein ACREJC_18100 [Tepidisphaeraceae bacterium]